MSEDRPIPDALKAELSDWRRWVSRVVVLSFAAMAGLSVVLMTRLSEHALEVFFKVQQSGSGRLCFGPLCAPWRWSGARVGGFQAPPGPESRRSWRRWTPKHPPRNGGFHGKGEKKPNRLKKTFRE